MTQEEKELLLRDLSARLPYNCRVFYEYVDDLDNKTYGYSLTLNTWCIDELNAEKAVIKPYLRPLRSMTEEEFIYFMGIRGKNLRFCDIQEMMSEYFSDPITVVNTLDRYSHNIDWLNKKMFDYRGLIEKGLAITVTNEDNPYK